MKQYARIDGGTVREIISRSNAFAMSKAYHPSLVWIEITGVVPVPQEDWLYDGTNFSAPLPPPPPPPKPDPGDELDAALAALDPTVVADLATRAFLTDFLKALHGQAGKAGRVAGRRL